MTRRRYYAFVFANAGMGAALGVAIGMPLGAASVERGPKRFDSWDEARAALVADTEAGAYLVATRRAEGYGAPWVLTCDPQ